MAVYFLFPSLKIRLKNSDFRNSSSDSCDKCAIPLDSWLGKVNSRGNRKQPFHVLQSCSNATSNKNLVFKILQEEHLSLYSLDRVIT